MANQFRKQCQLPESNIIYDPTDAELIIQQLQHLPLYRGIIETSNLPLFLQEEFGTLLTSLPVCFPYLYPLLLRLKNII